MLYFDKFATTWHTGSSQNERFTTAVIAIFRYDKKIEEIVSRVTFELAKN